MSRRLDRVDMWLAVAVLLGVVLALMLNFPHDSLWYDEALTAYVANDSWETLWRWCLQVDIQVPLHYIVLRGWSALIGDSEFALRALSALCVPLTVAAVIASGRIIVRRGSLGLAAGIFAGLLPGMYWVAYEVRAYSLALALYAWATAFLLAIVRGRFVFILGYALLMAGALYTHYTALAGLVAHGVIVAFAGIGPLIRLLRRIRGSARRLAELLAPVALAGSLFLPWLPVVLERSAADRSYYQGQGILPWISLEVMAGFRVLAQQDRPPSALPFAVAYGALVALGAPVSLVFRRTRRAALIGAALALIPLALTSALLYLNPKLTGRYFWPAWVGLDLLAGLALVALLRRRLMVMAAAAALVAVPWLIGPRGSSPDSDYRGAFAFLCAEGTPDDVILLRDGTLFVAERYYGGRAPCTPPRRAIGMPEALITDVTQHLSLEQTRAAMADIVRRRPPNVWVVSWQGDVMDPQAITYALLDAVSAHTIAARMFGDVRLDRYERIDFAALDALAAQNGLPPTEPLDLALPPDYPQLIGLRVHAPQVAKAGDVVVIQAWWRRGAKLQPDLRVSARINSLDGGWTYTQVDQPPSGWKFFDDRWPTDTPVFGRYELFIGPDVPAGRVAVRLVFYDALNRWPPQMFTVRELEVAAK